VELLLQLQAALARIDATIADSDAGADAGAGAGAGAGVDAGLDAGGEAGSVRGGQRPRRRSGGEHKRPATARVLAAWNALEMLCSSAAPSATRELLVLLRDVLRPALLSDDLASAGDGCALVRVPFVAQIARRERQLARLAEALAAAQAGEAAARGDAARLREAAAEFGREQERVARRARAAERRRVKMKLSVFFERRTMREEARAECASTVARLSAEVTSRRRHAPATPPAVAAAARSLTRGARRQVATLRADLAAMVERASHSVCRRAAGAVRGRGLRGVGWRGVG